MPRHLLDMRQRPVGQGGFHIGVLANQTTYVTDPHAADFQWIYDCGSTDSVALRREINMVAGHIFDVLFISHAHEDHINGIDRLLGACTVKEVVLPFLDDHARLLVLTRAFAQGQTSTLLGDFLSDPEGWLRARGVEQVTFVEPFDPDRPPPASPSPEGGGTPERPTGTIDDGFTEAPESHWRAPDAKIPFVDTAKVPGHAFISKILPSAPSGSATLCLKPFTPQPDKARLADFRREIEAEFGRGTSARDILEWCRTRAARRTLRDCYARLGSGSAYATLNLFSLALWVGVPEEGGHALTDSATLGISRTMSIHPAGSAWLHTGDMDLSDRHALSQFTTAYGSLLAKVGYLTLPHHGSDHNMDSHLLDALPKHMAVLAASRLGSSKHPGARVRQTIHQRPGLWLHHVNETPGSAFRAAHAVC